MGAVLVGVVFFGPFAKNAIHKHRVDGEVDLFTAGRAALRGDFCRANDADNAGFFVGFDGGDLPVAVFFSGCPFGMIQAPLPRLVMMTTYQRLPCLISGRVAMARLILRS